MQPNINANKGDAETIREGLTPDDGPDTLRSYESFHRYIGEHGLAKLANMLDRDTSWRGRVRKPVNQSLIGHWKQGRVRIPMDRAVQMDWATGGKIRSNEIYPELDYVFMRRWQ